MSDIAPRAFGQSADVVMPGDVVIPSRGRYKGIQCEVKDVRRHGARYHLHVVPVIPLSDEWALQVGERVWTISSA